MLLIISLAAAGIVVLLGWYANKKSRDLRVFTAGSALLDYLFFIYAKFFIYFCLIHGNTGNFSSFQFLHEARSILFFHTVIST